jgi:hypothetical protein
MGNEFQLENNILCLKTKSYYDLQYKEQINCHHIPKDDDDDDDDGSGGGDCYQTKSHHFSNFLHIEPLFPLLTVAIVCHLCVRVCM